MVKFAETSQPKELLAGRRPVLLVDRCQEALNFGALVANDEAAEGELHNVLVGHVQFVDELSSVWREMTS